MKLRRIAAAAALALSVSPSVRPPVLAQEPLKAAVMSDLRVGQDAPDFSLPYFTAAGPGPADQPFRLRAELGHIVVLVFSGDPADTLTRTTWSYLAAQAQSLFRPGVVVAGVVAGGGAGAAALAQGKPPTFKFLPDSTSRVHRQFGSGGVGRQAVYVITEEGRVAYRSRTFRVDDPREMVAFRKGLP